MTELEWLSTILQTNDLSVLKDNYSLYKDSFTIDVTELDALFSTSSKGNQRKWFVETGDIYVKEALWYRNRYWRDYLCEVIASEIYKAFNMPIPIPYVDYSVCYIKCGDKIVPGSLSKNFLTEFEELITFGRLLDRQGIEFPIKADFDTKWNLIVEVLNKHMTYDVTEDLVYMFVVDFLMGNEDRHINNFGLCRDWRTNKFMMIPLFDTGMSLLQGSDSAQPIMRPFGIRSVDCIQLILKKRNIIYKLPEVLDISKCSFPSKQSMDMLMENARLLSLDVKRGDDYDIFRKSRGSIKHR